VSGQPSLAELLSPLAETQKEHWSAHGRQNPSSYVVHGVTGPQGWVETEPQAVTDRLRDSRSAR
jgi:hypothetical protein